MLLALILACATETAPAPAAPAAEAPIAEAPAAEAAPVAGKEAPNPNIAYGEAVDASSAVSVDEVIAAADTYNGKPITLKGTVKEVCQKKGCWHTIATSDPNVDVMVKDKAYGIFLPFDAAGKTVAVKGTFSVEILPLEEARHYASDAGKDPSTITEAPKTFLMDADGVALL